MAHTLQPLPKWLNANRPGENHFKYTCQNHHADLPGDPALDGISPCSHFDHCERPAVIWVYHEEVWALCQTCYNFGYPTTHEWYRVVKISPDFKGVL